MHSAVQGHNLWQLQKDQFSAASGCLLVSKEMVSDVQPSGGWWPLAQVVVFNSADCLEVKREYYIIILVGR